MNLIKIKIKIKNNYVDKFGWVVAPGTTPVVLQFVSNKAYCSGILRSAKFIDSTLRYSQSEPPFCFLDEEFFLFFLCVLDLDLDLNFNLDLRVFLDIRFLLSKRLGILYLS